MNRFPLFLLLLGLGGISSPVWGQAEPAESDPALAVVDLEVRPAGPQVLGSGRVEWIAQASGGDGDLNYAFLLKSADGEERVMQRGSASTWLWTPEEAGPHRVRALVRDALGNQVESPWSDPYEIADPLEIESPQADLPSPQTAGTVLVAWTVQGASGGVGQKTYDFELRPEKGSEVSVQQGDSPHWFWQPGEGGRYQVRVVVRDALGNEATSGWSSHFVVAPPLEVSPPEPVKPSPQIAQALLAWRAEALGGVGEKTYVYEVSRDGAPAQMVQEGPLARWAWSPELPGEYRVRVAVSDELDNRVESDWSESFRIEPPLTVDAPEGQPAGPQMLGSAKVEWTVASSGGVGERNYSFFLRSEGGEKEKVQSGASPSWEWVPESPGSYQVGVTVTDVLGNTVESPWSSPYQIAPPLEVTAPMPDRRAPQAAQTVPVGWSVEARGGVGEKSYSFEIARGEGQSWAFPTGSAATLRWRPGAEGEYRVRVLVSDAMGNSIQSDWSQPYRIEAPLKISPPTAAPSGPQAAGTVDLSWSVQGAGGVGEKTFAFEILNDRGEPVQKAKTTDPKMVWRPEKAGGYRVRVTMRDALGNEVVSPLSKPYEIAAPLRLESLQSDRSSPQAAQTVPVVWTAAASGGVGEKRYKFEILPEGGSESTVQRSASDRWSWEPQEAGRYRVRVSVSDALGNAVQGNWSEPFKIAPPLKVASPEPAKPGPQAALQALLAWTVEGSGGVGEKTYAFEVSRDGGLAQAVQTGLLGRWVWSPEEPGEYQVRASVSDALGNRTVSRWSSPYRIEPQLTVGTPEAKPSGPQMLGSVTVTWKAPASGGVGDRNYAFLLRLPDGSEREMQSGPSSSWRWTPEVAGPYRVRVTVSDEKGNEAQSPWSEPYGIAPPLQVEVPVPDRGAPQAAQTVPIVWSAKAIGGIGEKSYSFQIDREGGETLERDNGNSAKWTWKPETEGTYRVRVNVRDALGNQIRSGWSEAFRVEPPLQIAEPSAAPSAPQVADTVDIAWTVEGRGGVGEKSFAFELLRGGGEPLRVQAGADSRWIWRPEGEGDYKVRATMRDALGNQVVSSWSSPYTVTEPLRLKSLVVDRQSPQAARTVPIVWTAQASGGVGEKTYEFQMMPEGGIERPLQYGQSESWSWTPKEAGRYRVRVKVRDELGNLDESEWSPAFEIAPPMTIGEVATAPNRSEFLIESSIFWKAQAHGGVGAGLYLFYMEQEGGNSVLVQESSSPQLSWMPRESGKYRLRLVFRDSLGNEAQSPWSSWVKIVAPMRLEGLTADLSSPQRALSEPIRWTAMTSGGVGEIIYEFQTMKNDIVVSEQVGPESDWDWTPRKAGLYRMRVIARDEAGMTADSGWTREYRIDPAIGRDALIAFLPVENLTGVAVPLADIEESFSNLLSENGFNLLDSGELSSFMARYRWRNTGGITNRMAQRLREETGAKAVLFTSVETFQGGDPVRISLISRLVLCGERPQILWMKSVGLTGIDSPGLLGLGTIRDSSVLVDKAQRQLLSSLQRYLGGEEASQRLWYLPGDESASGKNAPAISLDGKFLPRSHYRASQFEAGAPYSVAIVPFLNEYARKNAGFVVPLHLMEVLYRYENLEVFEPGVIWENLLKYRLIMPAGPSLAISDILASPTTIDADLVLSGQVFDYQGLEGTPKVDFSVQIFDGKKRDIVWWSRSYATGDEGVYFFDVGQIHSVQGLAGRMSAAIGAMLFDGNAPSE